MNLETKLLEELLVLKQKAPLLLEQIKGRWGNTNAVKSYINDTLDPFKPYLNYLSSEATTALIALNEIINDSTYELDFPKLDP